MPADRNISAFDKRAQRYDQGWLGRLHHDIVRRTVDVALSAQPRPRRILDVGCGSGYLLRALADRCPDTVEFAGVDPAPSMLDVARLATGDPRFAFALASADHLPYPVNSSTSW